MTLIIDLILWGAVLGGILALLDDFAWRREFGKRMERRLRRWGRE